MPDVCPVARLRLACLLTLATLAMTSTVVAAPPDKPRVAVLDFHDSSGGALTAGETQYLADVLRGVARRTLPADAYILMTRENILDLLPPDRMLSECAGACAIEFGRYIEARYVVTGEVTMFGGQLRLTMQLYDTREGNLLAQRLARAEDVLGLEPQLEREAPGLLMTLRGGGPGGPAPTGEGRLGGTGEAWTAVGAAEVVVSFNSEPVGAMVEIDGRPVGSTPCTRPLSPGLYQLGIKKVRYVPHNGLLEVKDGMEGVSVTLTPDFGWLTVTSDPAGLEVTVDGRLVGRTPLRDHELDTGAHDVLVTSPQHHPEGKRVVIERGERERLEVAPVPRNGGLKVVAVDADGNAAAGRVLVGGVDVGATYTPLTLLVGAHEVEVRGEAGRWSGAVTVVERELVEVEARLVGGLRPGAAQETALGLTMVSIAAGTFTMGTPTSESGRDDDEKQHRVTLTQGFLMSTTEVTQTQYETVVGKNPSHFKGRARPVEKVSWFDAVEFCNALSEREGLRPAYRISGTDVTWDRAATGYRLPTEAEWEYACRAGTTTRYHSGDGDGDLARVGWYSGNSGSTTHDVAKREPNAWGLYDMHGNVWEWCWDWYGGYPGGSVTDPTGSGTGSNRVLRGGSWNRDKWYCRSGDRFRNDPVSALYNYGFRVVRSSAR